MTIEQSNYVSTPDTGLLTQINTSYELDMIAEKLSFCCLERNADVCLSQAHSKSRMLDVMNVMCLLFRLLKEPITKPIFIVRVECYGDDDERECFLFSGTLPEVKDKLTKLTSCNDNLKYPRCD
jgi:hypothetical protein